MTSAVEILSEHERNLDWINTNYGDLKKEYLGMWVAVKDGKVVDHDKSYLKLAMRLKRKYRSEYSRFALGYVTEKPIELILSTHEDLW